MRRLTGLGLFVVTAFLVVAPIHAAEMESPAAFLRALYGHYPLPSERDAPVQTRPKAWLAEPLLGLVLRDRAAARASGEVAALDFDPICACQDDTGLKGVDGTVQSEDAAKAKAVVRFSLSGTSVSIRHDLVRSGAGWRIADVRTKDVPSLVTLLRKSSP